MALQAGQTLTFLERKRSTATCLNSASSLCCTLIPPRTGSGRSPLVQSYHSSPGPASGKMRPPAALLWLLGACTMCLAFPDEEQLSTFLVSIKGLEPYAAAHSNPLWQHQQATSCGWRLHVLCPDRPLCHALPAGGPPDWLPAVDAAIWQVLLRGGAGTFAALLDTTSALPGGGLGQAC